MIKETFNHVIEFLAEFFGKEEVWVFLFFVGVGAWIVYAFFDAVRIILRNFFLYAWPLILFFFLFGIFESFWLFVRQERFKRKEEYVLLELRIPREVKKSPQAMEEVLMAVHALRNAPGTFKEKYLDGEITRIFALELVSFGGEARFFIRMNAGMRGVVEAALYSFYPDLEVREVEDYVGGLPKNQEELAHRRMKVWGTEMVLAREAAYPIRTYDRFENIAEEKQFDPISTFLEVLGKVPKDETVGVQLLLAPAAADWRDGFKDFLEKLKTPTTIAVEEEGGSKEVTVARSPGHTDILKAVEENLSKPAFLTLVRIIHFMPESAPKGPPARGALGAFNQFTALDLNNFKANKPTATKTDPWVKPYVFPKTRLRYRQERLLWNYRMREVPPETWAGKFITSHRYHSNFKSERFFMSVKGIATVFHPPTAVVLTAPHLRRTESRRAGPPAGLAIFGEEEEIEKFQ
ncbi:MAG: hypothetical protein HYU81_03145 [Candidatus Brennerbacteria bacterium]|nr:hypothetical protein [Candidatus Brennerbacteria bacterium]